MIEIKPASVWKPGERGAYAGLPMSVYLAMPGVNRSLLNTVADRPSHHSAVSVSSAAQQWGTLFNDLLFFGTREYYVQPVTYVSDAGDTKPWSGTAKVCKEWIAAHQDKPIIPATGPHGEDWLNKALDKTVTNPRVADLMANAHFEVTILGAGPEEYKFPLCKCRPDLIKDGERKLILADLKTTTDAGTLAFGRQILKFGYHKQAAHCRRILASLGHEEIAYYFIIVEKGDDPRVQVRRLPDRAMDVGDMDLDDEWKVYHRCKLTGMWPDFPDEPEPHVIGEVDLPDYLYPQEDEITPA